MCDMGLTEGLMVAGLVVSAAGTAASVASSMAQVEAQNNANKYNASIQNRNAQVQDMEAANTIAEGDIAAKEHDRAVKAQIGSQEAAFAGSGAVVGTGTALDVTNDTAYFGKLDSLTIQSNAARTAWGQTQTGVNYSASANLLSSSKGSPAAAGAGSLLSGTSSMLQQVQAGKQAGAFD